MTRVVRSAAVGLGMSCVSKVDSRSRPGRFKKKKSIVEFRTLPAQHPQRRRHWQPPFRGRAWKISLALRHSSCQQGISERDKPAARTVLVYRVSICKMVDYYLA